jgi:hypothetical protein
MRKPVLIFIAVLFALFLITITSTMGGATSGSRVVITIHSMEAIDELEGFGDEPDLAIVAWVDEDLVIDNGPYNDQNYIVCEIVYSFYTEKSSFQFEMQVYEVDMFSDDEVDISSVVGGGSDDYSTASRGAAFVGTYNLGTKELTGDEYTMDGEWYVTNGEMDGSTSADENDGEVYFNIEVNNEARLISHSPEEETLTIEEGESLTFSVELEDDENDPITIFWYIDDYLYDDIGTSFEISSSPGSAGSYEILCFAFEGLETTPFVALLWDLIVNEYNFPPLSIISAPNTGDLLETIVFSASDSYDPDSNNLEYEWMIDGEYAGDTERLYHYFIVPGTHVILLKVTDGDKSDTASKSLDISDIDLPDPTDYILGIGTGEVETDYLYDLKMTNSWSLLVTQCEDYSYYLKAGLWFDFQVNHDGASVVSFSAVDAYARGFDLNCVLDSSTDVYSVEFKPTLYFSIEKRYTDGKAAEELLYAPLPLPSMTDADGDDSHIMIGSNKIYLWDSWVQIYSLDSVDSLGDVFEYDYTATLAEIDVLDLISSLASGIPSIRIVTTVLDIFLDIDLEFNLNINIWFSEDLIVFTSIDNIEASPDVNFWMPEKNTNEGGVESLEDGDVVYTALNTYMNSEIYGSMDIVVTFTYIPIISDFISFIFGKEQDEFRYSLLRTRSLYGDTKGLSVLGFIATVYEYELVVPTPTISEVKGTHVQMAWASGTPAVVEEYNIYLAQGQVPNTTTEALYNSVGGSKSSVEMTGLKEGKEYWVVVETVGVDGSSKTSQPVSFKTKRSSGDSPGFAGIEGVLTITMASAIMIIIARKKREAI